MTTFKTLSDFSTPAPLPPPPYTWSVPTGKPWTIGGLGDLSTLRAQLAANLETYDRLKAAVDPLIVRFPFSSETYLSMVHSIAAVPGTTVVRLTGQQFASVARAVLSSSSQSFALARALLSGTPSEGQQRRAVKVMDDAKRVLLDFSRLVDAAQRGDAAVRSVGLGDLLSVGAIALIAAAVLLGVIVVSALVYAVFSSIQTNEVSRREAERACTLDAAAGNPCSGAAFQAYRTAAIEAQRNLGLIPNIGGALDKAGSLVFWGGLLTVAAVLGYAAYTAEPARRAFASRYAMNGYPSLGQRRQQLDRQVDDIPVAALRRNLSRYVNRHDTDGEVRATASEWARERLRDRVGVAKILAKLSR